MKKCLSSMCGKGSLPVNEDGWCEVRRSGELGDSREADLVTGQGTAGIGGALRGLARQGYFLKA